MKGEIVLYHADEAAAHIEVRIDDEQETIWLTQKQMGVLFDKDSDTIGLHLKNIYAEQELAKSATTELFSVVQKEGKRAVKRQIKYYNLDAIISVGYRVNSKRGTQFRKWATQRLKDYLLKGYAINNRMNRLEDNAQYGGFTAKRFHLSHDRFLIIDGREVYHLGASLKDLGRRWFAFSKLEATSVEHIMNSILKLV